MRTQEQNHERRATWSVALVGAARTAFGVIWAVNAYLTWRPSFAAHYVGYLHNAAKGQPHALAWWFDAWIAAVTRAPEAFVLGTRIVETYLALALLTGFARRLTYALGAAFSLLVWATAEGFSGPYVTGAANLGPALVYVLVFFTLWVAERIVGPTPYGLDVFLERRFARWRKVAEPAGGDLAVRAPRPLPRRTQAAAIAGVAVAVGLLVGGLQSALAVPPATPANAAAAVSPLSLATDAPVPTVRDARLPPLASEGDVASITLEATDATVTIANGVTYAAWTFGGTVPAPILHVRQGQTVNVTFVNHGHMKHSIDLHAAQVAPNVAYRDAEPGQTIEFSFVAKVPGAFVYHCGTAPVLVHMANGMYGAIIVDPAKPLPPADASYVIVQGEWYTSHLGGKAMGGDLVKMGQARPDEVVFNGVAFQYRDHPLPAKVGKRVRLYVVDAGPNLPSAFHVIGGMFDTVYPDGDAAHALHGVSTYAIAPGAGAVLDVIPEQPGVYSFVDHSMKDMEIGAVGRLQAMP